MEMCSGDSWFNHNLNVRAVLRNFLARYVFGLPEALYIGQSLKVCAFTKIHLDPSFDRFSKLLEE